MALVSSFRRVAGSRTARVGLGAAVLVIAAVAWLRLPSPPPQPIAQSTQSVAAEKTTWPRTRANGATRRDRHFDRTASSRLSVAMPPRRAEDLPSILAPIDERVALLEPMARVGRTDAMLALGRALLDCRLVDTMDDDAIRDHFIDLLLEQQQGMPDVINDDRLETMTHGIVDRTIKLRDGCARLGEIGDDAWLEWIGRAAQAGDVWAIIDYVTLAVGAESIDGSALETSSEEIAERRARGSAHLQSALQRGDCMVLPLFAQAYSDGPNGKLATDFPADAGKSYAFLVAARLWMNQMAPQGIDADWQAAEDEAAAALAPIPRADAQALGEAIDARYCRNRKN